MTIRSNNPSERWPFGPTYRNHWWDRTHTYMLSGVHLHGWDQQYTFSSDWNFDYSSFWMFLWGIAVIGKYLLTYINGIHFSLSLLFYLCSTYVLFMNIVPCAICICYWFVYFYFKVPDISSTESVQNECLHTTHGHGGQQVNQVNSRPSPFLKHQMVMAASRIRSKLLKFVTQYNISYLSLLQRYVYFLINRNAFL